MLRVCRFLSRENMMMENSAASVLLKREENVVFYHGSLNVVVNRFVNRGVFDVDEVCFVEVDCCEVF